MDFLKKLFGHADQSASKATDGGNPGDLQGLYFYVQCDRCGAAVRLRADKQYDLINEEGGYVWHKTIVDNRCFRPMPTVVYLDSHYTMTRHEITGGHYITAGEYESLLAEQRRTTSDEVEERPQTTDDRR